MSTNTLFLIKDPYGNVFRPADMATLRQWILDGRIPNASLIAPVGTNAWQPVNSHPDLADLFTPSTTPPSPPSLLALDNSLLSHTVISQPDPSIPPSIKLQDVPTTNPLAIASLVLSLVGTLGLLGALALCVMVGFSVMGAILGIIFGKIAQKEIRTHPDQEKGMGIARAGIIIGVIVLLASVAIPIYHALSFINAYSQAFRGMR